ncbi:hypothetical protein [Tenuifilum thalassicum]|uniref:hypothetical protein n=1 Tax=Tenuifilum thalassicum TaxID=2590900 RepID=UPI001563D6C0|nr:hypothetical protein [Tenuifilum thalassicum]
MNFRFLQNISDSFRIIHLTSSNFVYFPHIPQEEMLRQAQHDNNSRFQIQDSRIVT